MTDSQLIVAKLKTHANLKSVVPFGSTQPTAPYTVVKMEQTGLGYTRVRVIAHFSVGQQVALEEYCRKDVFDLLAFQPLSDGTGRRIILQPLGLGPVVTTNSDASISQEAVFRLPEMNYV